MVPPHVDQINCPDECDFVKYTSQVSYGKLVDNGDYILQSLLRKGNTTHPNINPMFWAEYETYVKDIFDHKLKSEGATKGWDGIVHGPVYSSPDPRPEKR